MFNKHGKPIKEDYKNNPTVKPVLTQLDEQQMRFIFQVLDNVNFTTKVVKETVLPIQQILANNINALSDTPKEKAEDQN